ncbi:hypothetical protein E4T47_03507 [Aureobasidium subglaciale]|nr:hypothetical protein E4T47_03507 [Aureobasidium subglaciale]
MTLHTYSNSPPLCYFVTFAAAVRHSAFSEQVDLLRRPHVYAHDLEIDCAFLQLALGDYSSVPGDASSLRGSLHELFNLKNIVPPPLRVIVALRYSYEREGGGGGGGRIGRFCSASICAQLRISYQAWFPQDHNLYGSFLEHGMNTVIPRNDSTDADMDCHVSLQHVRNHPW